MPAEPPNVFAEAPSCSRSIRTALASTLVASVAFTVACSSDAVSPMKFGETTPPASGVTVAIKQSVDTLSIGQPSLLTAVVTDAANAVVNRPITWTSTDPALASVNASGLVTGIAQGTARIVASAGTAADTATLQISGASAPFQIMPNAASVALGGSLQMSIASLAEPAHRLDDLGPEHRHRLGGRRRSVVGCRRRDADRGERRRVVFCIHEGHTQRRGDHLHCSGEQLAPCLVSRPC